MIHPYIQFITAWGAIYLDIGDTATRIEFQEKSLEIQETLSSPNYKSMSIAHYNLALTWKKQGNLPSAIKHAECSVHAAIKHYGQGDAEVKENQALLDRLRQEHQD